MANKVEDISKMIDEATEAIEVRKKSEDQKKTDELNKKKDEFNRRYEENLAKLKATGIVEIFEEVIEKEIVILSPAHKEINIITTKGIFGRTTETKTVKDVPRKLAYISWEGGLTSSTGSSEPEYDFDHDEAIVCLNFDQHFIDNPWSESHATIWDCEKVVAVMQSNGNFSLGGDNISDINKENLIKKVGECILQEKGLKLPKARK